MNIIYVGFLYPDRLKEELLRLGSAIDFPGDKFQHGLLQGLDAVLPRLTVVSSAFMSPYPKIKKIFFKSEDFSHNGTETRDKYVGGINFPGIKMLSEFIRIRRGIKRKLSNKDKNVVILYELHTPFMLAVKTLRKKVDVACLIVPDLPEYMSDNNGRMYRMAKRLDRKIINNSLNAFDSFVLFSPHMKEKLNLGTKPLCIIEGVYSPDVLIKKNVEKDPHKVILYTGALSERSGVLRLLEAFERIPDLDYRLWIRGDGDAIKSIVIKKMAEDNRIQYFERMSLEELTALQKKATVLINPVSPSSEYSKYFFPSKTMEYLASGTPTIMYKLACLPEEYYNHLYFVEEDSVEGIKNTILNVCSKSKEELDEFGKKASVFISREKTPIAQARKIANLINN